MTTVCATPHTSVYMGAMPNPAFVYIPAMATPKTHQNYSQFWLLESSHIEKISFS